MSNSRKGQLWLIPITIGSDNPQRYQPHENIEVIGRLQHFVVENARTARQYIKHLIPAADISSLEIVEIDKHDGYRYPKEEVMNWLQSGLDVGLMSEAGCPAVADPGSLVVRDCHKCGIRVNPLVGPSSILLSLMSSGFSGQSFCFHGYLPFDAKLRKKKLQEFVQRALGGETQIFIEAPYRNDKLIQELASTLPAQIEICVAIDLTTEQEEIHRYTPSEWLKRLKGGFTCHKRPAIFLLGV